MTGCDRVGFSDDLIFSLVANFPFYQYFSKYTCFLIPSLEEQQHESEGGLGASNIKRRSLSETAVDKAALLEQQQQQQQLLDTGLLSASSQAKVAKLEVKSQKVVNITTSAFHSPSFSNPAVDAESSKQRSPLLSLVSNRNTSNSPKKAHSSENISLSGLSISQGGSRLRSPGPFSFSLTAPTSTLSSFKFLEKHNGMDKSNIVVNKPTNGGLGVSLSDQIPDFSVFNKVPTPTDELPPSRKFVFVSSSSSSPTKELPVSNSVKNSSKKEDVWNPRSGVFVPIHKSGGSES